MFRKSYKQTKCIRYMQNCRDYVTSCDMQYISCSLTEIQALKETRYVYHTELRRMKWHNQFISHRILNYKGFDSVVLREDRHLVNVLTHFMKRASELALTVQQILKYICENTLQFQTNVRNNRFKYYDKGYLVASLSIDQMFVMQICSSRSVSRSNVHSTNK